MGNESSAAAPASAASLTANTPNTITKTSTPSILSTAPITTVATMPTTSAPTTTTAAISAAATTTTTTTTTAATTTTLSPTPTINSTASIAKDTSTTPAASAESTSTPTFYSLVKSLTSDSGKAKSASSAYSHWYKWSKFEQQKRDKSKILWYMGSPITTTNTSSPTAPTITTTNTSSPTAPTITTTNASSPVASTITMTTAKIDDSRKEVSDPLDITAVPSFPLRSTAVYSPPHGDRIPSGRNELINTDTSIFKYYLPENRSKRMAGIHTKATMYKMNTFSRQIPLPAHPSQLTATNASTNATRNNSSVPTFVSRGLQTSLEAQPMDSSSTQMRYYEKQPSLIIPVSGLSNYRSTSSGFYHLSSKDVTSQPVLPSIEKPPISLNDQLRSSTTQSFPSHPPLPPPPLPPPIRPSILKNSSTVLSQDLSNPISEQTHNKVLEELRKRNKNTKDGVYRVKKVHVIEKTDPEPHPSAVSFSRPPRPPSSKASQSILRSEKLFFSELFNRKK